MTIKTEKEFRAYQTEMEALTVKGTNLGDMELLSEEEKERYIALSQAISEWEAAYHPLPGRVSTLITDVIRKKMESEDILVMLSDGAFDGFSQNGLEMAARYLKEMDVVRPQAIADGLYERITTNKEFEKRDDMTIMVLGIWDRY